MKFLKFWFPVILYSGIIFYASGVPNVRTPLSGIQFDKILHILVYIPFGFLVARGITSGKFMMSRTMFWVLICGASFLYGGSDEYHQSFVVGRDANIFDLLADTLGGTIGGAIFLMRSNYSRNSKI